MVSHTNAREREGTPHAINSIKNVNRSTRKKTRNLNGAAKPTKRKTVTIEGTTKTKSKTLDFNGTDKRISNALKLRAHSLIKDKSIDAQSRALIRYGLEINDPWLPELVRRADAGETIIYTVNSLKHPHPARMIQAKKRLKC